MPDRNRPQARDLALRALLDDFARNEGRRLRSIAGRAGARGELREDAVQQAFLAFLRSYPGDPTDRDGAFSYLARSIQTAVWHMRRSERRHDRRVEAARTRLEHSSPDALEAALAHDDAEQRRALLARLSEQERAVVFLVAAGFTHPEICEQLGLTMRQVRKRVAKANRRLRELDS